MRTFYQLLGNTVAASFTNMTVWFAITFFAYLQTRSVFVTGVMGGVYMAASALSSFWLGSMVDHHRKKAVMLGSSVVSVAAYAASYAAYVAAPEGAFAHASSPWLWILTLLALAGVLAGNIRGIALQTAVTMLVPEGRRDRANGLVGTAMGVSFLAVSVVSGFLVGRAGMGWVFVLAGGLTLLAILHLLFVTVKEGRATRGKGHGKVDIRGTLRIVSGVPGLFALILFATFNNLLGGVFMSLMDAYGLSLVSVETWGLLWGAYSAFMIAGGILVARAGLGKNPLRTLFLANVVSWGASALFTLQPSVALLSGGVVLWFLSLPFAEAAEQTVLQKVVPHERQGRVFGFAQSVEQAASPLTAFVISPFVQFGLGPFMTDGLGARLIGGWFGTGPARGIALAFTAAGVIGLVATLLAMRSRYYRELSAAYRKA